MPRLGSSDSPNNRSGLQRTRSGTSGGLGSGIGGSSSSFYRHHYSRLRNRFSRFKRWNFTTVSIMLVVAFVSRNLLFRDYKSEQISELQAAGLSPEEIERIVPSDRYGKYDGKGTLSRQEAEIEHMKKDISILFQEVKDLRSMLGGGSPAGGAAGGGGLRGGIRRRPGPSEGIEEALRDMDRIHQEKRKIREEQYLASHPDKAKNLESGGGEDGGVIGNEQQMQENINNQQNGQQAEQRW